MLKIAKKWANFALSGSPTGTENFESPPIKNLEKKPCQA